MEKIQILEIEQILKNLEKMRKEYSLGKVLTKMSELNIDNMIRKQIYQICEDSYSNTYSTLIKSEEICTALLENPK